jgi:hypothetical protein
LARCQLGQRLPRLSWAGTGTERHPTLYWRDRTRTGPTFHIDYIFVPRSAKKLLRRVSVGSYAKWVANVQKAGFRIRREKNVYLDIVKITEGIKP